MPVYQPTRKTFSFLALLVLLLPVATAPAADDDGHVSLAQAVINQSAVKPGTSAMAAVVLDVAKGFHVQSSTPAENLIPFQLKVDATGGFKAGTPVYPAGEIKEYKAIGKLSVYTGKIFVFIPFEVPSDAKPGAGKLSGLVSYQACDEAVCFPPEEVKFSIDVPIAGPADEIKPANRRIFKDQPATQPATKAVTGPATGPTIGPERPQSFMQRGDTAGETAGETAGQINAVSEYLEVLAPVAKPADGTSSAIPSFDLPDAPADKAEASKAKLTVRGALNVSALEVGKTARLAMVLEIQPRYHAQSNTPAEGFVPTKITNLSAEGVSFGTPVYPTGTLEELGLNGKLVVYSGKVVIFVPVTVKPDAKPGPIQVNGTINAQICDDRLCDPPADFSFTLVAKVVPAGTAVTPNETELFTAATDAAATPTPIATAETKSLPAAFGLAFLVGILFNVVPCVLPVLPLKAVGFYETAQHNRAKSVTYGLAFSLGVVAVFAVLGMLVVVLKWISWGELFSNPWFTGTLVIILLAMAANMFGLFTVNLPPGAYAFSPRHDTYFGNFLFGILTATLSTPCTFGLFVTVLTVALGAAPLTGLFMVIVVGVGMAFPYLVLSALPEVARKFPRTGPWAELVKQFMGFLILAVAIFFAQGWISRVVGPKLIYWLIYAVVIAGCVFLFARAIKFAKTRQAPVVAAIIALLIAVPGFVVAREFSVQPYEWKAYTPELLADLQSRDQVVLIDFTATWCVNCHTLEAAVLNSREIQRMVDERKVVMVKADITDQEQASYKFWKFDVKAVGVPLTMIYPPGRKDPIALAGIYSIDELKAAIDRAKPKAVALANQ